MRKSRSDGVATRAAILEAAADEFAEKGYELASARAVCARAEANAALSSRYFGTKEELYRTTAKSLFGDLGAPLAVLPEKMGSGDSPRVVISTPDSGDSPRLGSGDSPHVVRKSIQNISHRTSIVQQLRPSLHRIMERMIFLIQMAL